MTPAARVAAAIEVLDDILAGATAEKALTGWGRNNRFAGSKDRAAIRDHVFLALRCRASYAWLGGAQTGRGIMLGAMRAAGQLDEMFTGQGHAPAAVAPDEVGQPLSQAARATRLDMPEWMLPLFDGSIGERTDDVLGLLQHRAGLFLRVNRQATTPEAAQASLANEDIHTTPVDTVPFALRVISNERRVALSQAYLEGWVEIQDTSSQRAVNALGILPGQRVLDYCAGGGGKSLALAAFGAQVTAHDVNAARTKDIGPRARRAGVDVAVVTTQNLPKLPPFDVVFADAPCSGSGTWRRTPEAKWALTEARLDELTKLQDDVLQSAAAHVAKGGRLIYATCSVFHKENQDRVRAFLDRAAEFILENEDATQPSADGDGFYFAELHRR